MVPALPVSGERPYNRANPQLFAMFDIPGAKERHQSARVQGTRLSIELMEIQQVEHRTIRLRIQDPGAATLVLVVRDIDATLARVQQANAPIVTPSERCARRRPGQLLPDPVRAVRRLHSEDATVTRLS
jgi:hypothetical protein